MSIFSNEMATALAIHSKKASELSSSEDDSLIVLGVVICPLI
jgi:hypothetical protein